MTLYRLGNDSLEAVSQTSYQSEGVMERSTLQRLLRDQITVIDKDLFVLSEEFDNWENSRLRIDLLCIDRDARLVVIELKRTDDGGRMELQALRYAAMISTMTFKHAVDNHQKYLSRRGLDGDAEEALLNFLGWEDIRESDFGNEVRIFLVAAEFSTEITTTALWLSKYGLDVRCVRIKPYKLNTDVLVDVQQIVPLPEAAEYQVRIREKAQEERKAREAERDVGRFELTIGDQVRSNLPKRRLIYEVVAEALKRGADPQKILDGNRFWIIVDGQLNQQQFLDAAATARLEGSSARHTRRFYTMDADLLHYRGRTYALTTQWGSPTETHVQRIIREVGMPDVSYERVAEDNG